MEHIEGEIRISEVPSTFNLVAGKARIVGKIGESANAERIRDLWNAANDMTTEQVVKYIKNGAAMVKAIKQVLKDAEKMEEQGDGFPIYGITHDTLEYLINKLEANDER